MFNTLDALLIFVMFADAINALANVHMLGIDDGGRGCSMYGSGWQDVVLANPGYALIVDSTCALL